MNIEQFSLPHPHQCRESIFNMGAWDPISTTLSPLGFRGNFMMEFRLIYPSGSFWYRKSKSCSLQTFCPSIFPLSIFQLMGITFCTWNQY
ncbi:hypothetical protein FKM82_009709 [Ascaphus truei]